MIRPNLLKAIGLSGAAARSGRVTISKKLSGASASSDVNRGSRRNRVPQLSGRALVDRNSLSPLAGGCVFTQGRSFDHIPGTHFTRAFRVGGCSGWAFKLILKDTCRKSKSPLQVKFATYYTGLTWRWLALVFSSETQPRDDRSVS